MVAFLTRKHEMDESTEFGLKSTIKNIIYTLVSVKKWHVESLTLEYFMALYFKACQMNGNCGKPIFVTWTRT